MQRKNSRTTAAVSQVWDDDDDSYAADDSSRTIDTGTDAETDLAPETLTHAEDLGELIDGGEDQITDDFEELAQPASVAVAVDGDDHSQVTAAVEAAVAVAKKKKVSSVPTSKEMTKADYVRAEIERRQKAGDSIRPRDIIEALAKRGVKVTPPQVSVLVKKLAGPGAVKKTAADQTPAQKAKAAINRLARVASAVKRPGQAVAARQPVQAAAKTKAGPKDGESEYSALFAAANFVGACGDLAAARKTLDAYEQLTAARA
jgi:hypothetical protein